MITEEEVAEATGEDNEEVNKYKKRPPTYYNYNSYLSMKKLLFILFFFSSFIALAQSVKVEGSIKDSIGNSLELANVIAFSKGTNKVKSYSITNSKGHYKLNLPTDSIYTFRISYIGFITQTDELSIPLNSSDIIKDYILKPENNQLDDVELTFEMPVTIKGDTIVYNSDSFTNGSERKLEDILKKLPGVEITDDGEIEIEGKTVSKVMVEGKDFFDGDSKIASKNIPSNAVDKIEVLRNYNEVTPVRGLGDDSDNIAINIRLKEGKKKFWFGEITAGIGTNDGYLVHPKLFYYSPKTSINIITDFNNVGEIPFTRQDYFRFSGGFRNMMSRSGTNFSIGSNSLGFSTAQNNMAREIISKFGALNFSYNPKETLTISGFSIFNESDIDMLTQSRIDNIVTGNIEDRTIATQQKTQLGLLKLSLNYIPNANTHFDYDIFAKVSKQTEEELINSQIDDNEENIINKQSQKPTSVNQNIDYYKVLNDKNIISVEAQHLYQDENPFLNFVRGTQPFESIIPTIPQEFYDISQTKNIISNKLDAKFDYYFILNKKSNINITLGSSFSQQNFDSSIFQLLDNGNQIDFDETELNNDVEYNFTDVFIGVHYKAITGKFTFTPGLTFHNYITNNRQLGSSVKNSDFNITPDLSIIFKLKQSETLRFNYGMTRQYTDVNKLAEGYVFQNFNTLFGGNRNLESALYNQFRLDYFNFSMFNFTNINASINYSRKTNAIKNISDFIGYNQTINSPYNSNLADETFSGSVRYGRQFGKFKLNLRANLNYQKLNGIVNDQPNESDSFTQNYRLSFGTNFKTAPNLEIGYSKTFNQYRSTNTSNDYTTDRPFAELDIIFLKHFTFVADYSYYNYSDGSNTIDNSYSFLNASLYFQKKDSKWEFILSGKNLTDNQSINRDSFNENYTSTSRYLVQPRRLLVTVKYNL